MNQHFSVAARVIIILACLVIVIAGLKAARELLVPFMLAVFVAVLLEPLVLMFRNRGLPNWLSIILIILFIALLWGLAVALVSSSVQQFIANAGAYQERLQALLEPAFQYSFGGLSALEVWTSVVDKVQIFSLASQLLNSIGQVLANTFMIILFIIFILAEQGGIQEHLQGRVLKVEEKLEQWHSIKEKISRYMVIKALISSATGVVIGLGLMLIGVDYPLLWGGLAFALNFIPTFGSLIAAGPPLLLALIQLGSVSALLTALLFFIVNLVLGNMVEPRVMGQGLGIPPLVVLLSLVLWGWILGPVGMLLAVPLTVTIKVVFESSPETRWISALLTTADKSR